MLNSQPNFALNTLNIPVGAHILSAHEIHSSDQGKNYNCLNGQAPESAARPVRLVWDSSVVPQRRLRIDFCNDGRAEFGLRWPGSPINRTHMLELRQYPPIESKGSWFRGIAKAGTASSANAGAAKIGCNPKTKSKGWCASKEDRSLCLPPTSTQEGLE